MTQIIHFEDNDLGSVDWELNKRVSSVIEQAPEPVRKIIKAKVEHEAKEFMLLILAGIAARNPQDYFAAVQRHREQLIGELAHIIG